MRRALSNVGGRVNVAGDADAARMAELALSLSPNDDPDALTHGFHTYAGRMHYLIARRLVQQLTRPTQIVLDPFCGGGTVPVEAMIAGRKAAGADLNPLAIRIARVRSSIRTATERRRFVACAEAVSEASLQRVQERTFIHIPLAPKELEWYAPHVALELAGLRTEIESCEREADREALRIVFSSLLVKVSNQVSDTVQRRSQKRIRKGLTTELFLRKAHELAERWALLERAAPERMFEPHFYEADVRQLARVLPGSRAGGAFAAHAIITSPPYGGTFDYVDHHVRRYPWLGISTERFRAAELGARRNRSGWQRDFGDALESMARVLRPDGWMALLIGDAEVAGARIDADEALRELAPRIGLRWAASANQLRPDWRGGPHRKEHLVLLRR